MNDNHIQFISAFKNKTNHEKPREKLAKYGPESLKLWELLAIILRTGERHKGGHFEDVEELSRRLLGEAGFKGIFAQNDTENMVEHFGIYRSHAQILVAISEAFRRIHGKFDHFDVSTPDKTAAKFNHLKKLKQEQCHVLHVQKNQCVRTELIAMGTGNQVLVTFSDIIRSALWLGIEEIIIVHNHLGKKEPSTADITWTTTLKDGAERFHNIKIRDHIIVGSDGYYSFAEAGVL